jgi:hypothetical protein
MDVVEELMEHVRNEEPLEINLDDLFSDEDEDELSTKAMMTGLNIGEAFMNALADELAKFPELAVPQEEDINVDAFESYVATLFDEEINHE